MKAAYQALAVIIPLIIMVSAVAVLAMAPVSQEEPAAVDPEPEPVQENVLPSWIHYNKSTQTLSARSEVTWTVFDMLHAYTEGDEVYQGYSVTSDSITLTPGKYRIAANDESFIITVSGKVSRTLEWDYLYEGTSYPVSVTYEIDIDDYVKITESSQEYNQLSKQLSGGYISNQFADMPSLVTVNDTVRSIVSQLEKRFIQIGGSVSDRQGYAEFLASMAQIPIEYPDYKSYGDMQVWGVNEYWQNTMETLYHTVGDCEDKAALACALFVAAGYKAAMCGVVGHVTAGVAIDGFVERSEAELTAMGMDKWVLAADKDITGQDTETVYYAVETIKEEQHYIGYLESGPASCIGDKTLYWGVSGFYPVN